MPYVEIHLLESQPLEQQQLLMMRVTDVVSEVLQLPAERIRVRIDEARTDCAGDGPMVASAKQIANLQAGAEIEEMLFKIFQEHYKWKS